MRQDQAQRSVVMSIGDPAGIGPEVALKAALTESCWKRWDATPVLVAPRHFLEQEVRRLNLSWPNRAEVVEPTGWSPTWAIQVGQIRAEHGAAAIASLRHAHEMVLSMPQRAVLVTAPISKEAIHLAGVDFPGHTELLATWCGLDPNSDVRMMLAIPSLRVILHSIHIPLVAVPASVEPVSLHRTFQITAGWCLSQGNPGAKVAVCGLNPHAGENGYLGREELDILSPAIDRANETLGPVTFHGPFPGDTIFARALVGEFDVVVAMYHDQGLVAVKTLDMHRGVNHTLGLPYVRTSPDHGTAFGLAGRGMALEGSMLAAVEMASDYLARRCSRTGTSREAPEGPRHD